MQFKTLATVSALEGLLALGYVAVLISEAKIKNAAPHRLS